MTPANASWLHQRLLLKMPNLVFCYCCELFLLCSRFHPNCSNLKSLVVTTKIQITAVILSISFLQFVVCGAVWLVQWIHRIIKQLFFPWILLLRHLLQTSPHPLPTKKKKKKLKKFKQVCWIKYFYFCELLLTINGLPLCK